MNEPIAFEIPESTKQIAAWLESVICQGDLRGLVAQLSAIHHALPNQIDLEKLLANDRQAVLSGGLGCLNQSQIRRLLTVPELLLDLQELVMVEGERYWQIRFRNSADAPVAINFDSLLTNDVSVLPRPSPDNDTHVRRHDPRRLTAILGLAAIVLVTVGGLWLYQRHGERQVAVQEWGWEKDNALPTNVKPAAYVAELAKGANAWFNVRPTNQAELKQRLEEFAAGCQKLIDARHPPLSESDEKRLWYACQQWQTEIEQQLATLDGTPFEVALSQADGLTKRIIETLPTLATDV